MKISEKLNEKTILNSLNGENRSEVIRELLNHLVKSNYLSSSIKLFSFIDSTESINNLAIERGIAFEHSTSMEIDELVCVLGISTDGIIYNEEDVHPCHIILLSLSPKESPDIHRKFISKFRLLISNIQLKDKIINARSPIVIKDLLANWDQKEMEEDF